MATMLEASARHASPAPTIPVFRPDFTEDEIAAVAATMRSGWIGPGPRAAEFEQRFAAAMDVAHAVSVASGTAALQSALAALAVAPGDEVIVPSFTWISVFHVVAGLGATPVFADIEPDYLTIDPDDVERRITSRTRGIVAVHHGGRLADLDALHQLAARHGLWLVDDAAHACGARWHGRPVGGLCTATCFSFNSMKNLAVGDGGMVTTNDAALAHRVSLYRSLGIDRDTYARYGDETAGRPLRWSYDVVAAGERVHMNDLAASIGLVQLRRLDDLNGKRQQLVMRYEDALADVPQLRAVQPRPGTLPSHHMFTVLVPQRDRFVEQMAARGITVGVHYIPIHLFSVAQRYRQPLPATEQVWPQVATLPLYPAMTPDEQDRVIAEARAIARSL